MKINSRLIILVLCFFYIQNKAQVYFNNRYDNAGSFDGTNSIDTFQNNYLTVGAEGFSGLNVALSLYLFNSNGTIDKKKLTVGLVVIY